MGYYRTDQDYKINIYSPKGEYIRTFGNLVGVVPPQMRDTGVPANVTPWYPGLSSYKGKVYLYNLNVLAEFSIKGELLRSVNLCDALGIGPTPNVSGGNTYACAVNDKYIGITSTLDWSLTNTQAYILNKSDMSLKYVLDPGIDITCLCFDGKYIYAGGMYPFWDYDSYGVYTEYFGGVIYAYLAETGAFVHSCRYIYQEQFVKIYVYQGRLYAIENANRYPPSQYPWGQHGNLKSFKITKDSDGNITSIDDPDIAADSRSEITVPVLKTFINGARATVPFYKHAPDGNLYVTGRHSTDGVVGEWCGFWKNKYTESLLLDEDPEEQTLSADSGGVYTPIPKLRAYFPKNAHYEQKNAFYDFLDPFATSQGDADPIFLPSDLEVVEI